MKCSWVRKRLMEYVEGETSARELSVIRDHLARCCECRNELEAARQASNLLQVLQEGSPAPDFLPAVRHIIASQGEKLHRSIMPRLAMGFSVLLVVAAIGVGWILHLPVKPTTAPTVGKQQQVPVAEKLPVVVDHQAVQQGQVAIEPQPVHMERKVHRRQRQTGHVIKRTQTPVARSPERSDLPGVEQTDSSEAEMLFVLQPREPESYTIVLSAEEESPASRVSIVREFNTGGEVTSVTIDQSEIPETPASDSSDSGTTRFIDTPSTQGMGEWTLDFGGYIENA